MPPASSRLWSRGGLRRRRRGCRAHTPVGAAAHPRGHTWVGVRVSMSVGGGMWVGAHVSGGASARRAEEQPPSPRPRPRKAHAPYKGVPSCGRAWMGRRTVRARTRRFTRCIVTTVPSGRHRRWRPSRVGATSSPDAEGRAPPPPTARVAPHRRPRSPMPTAARRQERRRACLLWRALLTVSVRSATNPFARTRGLPIHDQRRRRCHAVRRGDARVPCTTRADH